jgi:hypothetical protein
VAPNNRRYRDMSRRGGKSAHRNLNNKSYIQQCRPMIRSMLQLQMNFDLLIRGLAVRLLCRHPRFAWRFLLI